MELGKLNNLTVLICFTFLASIPHCSYSSSLRDQYRVGDTCDSNLACSSVQGSVKCETALLIPLCLCNKGFVSNEARNNCLPIRQEEGQLCWSNSQCSSGLGRLSRCEQGHCECFDSKSQEGKSRIIRYDPETKKCAFWNQQQINSKDVDILTTSDETETTTTPRWPPVLPPPLIGESCKNDEHCKEVIKGPVQCKDLDASKICQCDEGYTENESRNECIEILTTTATSDETETTTTPRWPPVLPPPLIGESCKNDEHCKEVIKGPVQCKDLDASKICQCDEGYAENESRNECIEILTTTENHATYLVVSGAVMLLNLIISFNYCIFP